MPATVLVAPVLVSGHCKQAEEPEAAENVVAAHGLHLGLPGEAEKEPAGHFEHDVDPEKE